MYVVGQEVTFPFTFKVGGVPVDPESLTFRVKDPDGTVYTFEYDNSPEISRVSEGVFEGKFTLNKPGTWYDRWEANGNVSVAESSKFVYPSQFS